MPTCAILPLAFQSTLPTRGSDPPIKNTLPPDSAFQSTLPTRGSDRDGYNRMQRIITISIHAPHEGERLCVCLYATAFNAFQSTLPTRGSDTYRRL